MWWEIWILNLDGMLFIQKKKPKLNTQSISIKAKLFGTLFLLSTFHIVDFLITCNKTSHTFSICKEQVGIWLLEFENDERVIEMSFKIFITDFYS